MIESSQFKDCEETVLEVGRKHCSESKPIVEREPPAEKGKISTVTQEGAFQKNLITIPEQKRKIVKCKHYVVRRKSTVLTCKSK